MKIKIFSILIGLFAGLSVYSFTGYFFTRKLRDVGKKYKIKFISFTLIFISIIFLYFKLK